MFHALGLAIAGVVAAVVGTAGGITTVFSYPALLWSGLAPLPASIANTVAVVACLPGSALASRPELARRSRALKPLAVTMVLGGIAGAVLLVATPPRVFEKLVVPLLLLAAGVLVAQPAVTAWEARHHRRASARILPVAVLVAAVYNGYFGAGSGVILLVLLLLPGDDDLPVANALKNVLVGVGSVISAVTFALLAPVDWSAVLPLAAGLFAGSLLGPRVARRAPSVVIRFAAAALAAGLAVTLWIAP